MSKAGNFWQTRSELASLMRMTSSATLRSPVGWTTQNCLEMLWVPAPRLSVAQKANASPNTKRLFSLSILRALVYALPKETGPGGLIPSKIPPGFHTHKRYMRKPIDISPPTVFTVDDFSGDGDGDAGGAGSDCEGGLTGDDAGRPHSGQKRPPASNSVPHPSHRIMNRSGQRSSRRQLLDTVVAKIGYVDASIPVDCYPDRRIELARSGPLRSTRRTPLRQESSTGRKLLNA